MEIKSLVSKIVSKYHTRNPYEIAKALGCLILVVPLNNTRGFYQYFKRNSLIYINEGLDEIQRNVVCAHELGHAILHKKSNAVFLSRCTLQVTDKFEAEANHFAVELLYTDEDMLEYKDFSCSQISSLTGICEDLIKYKFENIIRNE